MTTPASTRPANVRAPEPSQSLLGGRYQVVRPLGGGRTTRVFEAWDRQESRRVAVKVVAGQLAADRSFVTRLEQAARTASVLVHPNVAALHGVERDGGVVFVVMELVDGSSLREMLATRGPLPPIGAARVASRMCAALAAAHARGITHGHLGPANVLLSIDGRVKITDFRLTLAARRLDDSPAADLRAVGGCLAAMLAGRESAGRGPAPADPADPAVPAELAAVVARATGDPEGGYRSAEELGRDLDRFLAQAAASQPGALVPSPATGRPDPRPAAAAAAASRRRRRRPARLAGLVGACLLAGGAVAAAAALPHRGPSGPPAARTAAPPSNAILPPASSQPGSSVGTATTAPAPPLATTAPAPRPTATTSGPAAGSRRVVPDVTGLRRAQAAGVLAEAGLGIEVQLRQVQDAGQVQRVLAQDPAAGQAVPAGTKVTVVVGSRRKA